MSLLLHNDDSLLSAHSVRFAVCPCPDIHIILLDTAGEPFARVVMSPEDWARASADILTALAAVRDRQGDTIGNVLGRA